MEKPIEHFWRERLQNIKEALEDNHFEVFLAEDLDDAGTVVMEKIIPKILTTRREGEIK